MATPTRRERKRDHAKAMRTSLTEPPAMLDAVRGFLATTGLSEAYLRNLEELLLWEYVQLLYPGGRPAFKRDWRRGDLK